MIIIGHKRVEAENEVKSKAFITAFEYKKRPTFKMYKEKPLNGSGVKN